jgi:hypothetical protein
MASRFDPNEYRPPFNSDRHGKGFKFSIPNSDEQLIDLPWDEWDNNPSDYRKSSSKKWGTEESTNSVVKPYMKKDLKQPKKGDDGEGDFRGPAGGTTVPRKPKPSPKSPPMAQKLTKTGAN